MKTITFALICFLAVLASAGEIITVDDDGSADFDSIQSAIEGSQDGDTIIVEPGTYSENILFNNKAVTLTGRDPDDPNVVGSTIITADSGYTVNFDSDEDSNSVLTGFSITGRGIRCYGGTTPVISKNIIRDCGNWGIYGQLSAFGVEKAAPVISENYILRNKGAVNSCDGPIVNNVISDNIYSASGSPGSGGLSYCDGLISGNVISYNYSGYRGGACYECNGDIENNIIIGNSSSLSGGGLSYCHGNIYNNIISGNDGGSSGGGLFGCKDIYNNTIVGNIASGRGGAISQCFGYITNNIIAYNWAGTAGGINGICENAYNLLWANQGGNYGDGAVKDSTEIIANPQFATNCYWDTNDTITDQSDDFWVDGDYHLLSEAGRWDPNEQMWVKDDQTSLCIDAGDPNTALIAEFWPHGNRVNIGAYGNTVQASWSLSDVGNIADLNYDGWVDYEDMALFTDKWLRTEVLLREDLDRNGHVDLLDLSIIPANWQLRPLPPTPDPMTWAMEPTVVSSTAIVMVATIATSSDDSGVEYYFKCDTSGGHDSDWQSEPAYTDSGLTAGTEYFYRVKARNKGNLAETEYSEASSATTTPLDTTSPNPDPAQWQTQPYRVSPSSIRMVAVTASDPSGVEYYFQCTTNSLYSSGWQDSTEYTASSLPEGVYSFVVRARDKSPNQNTTGNSTIVSVDLQPPTPDPMEWAEDGEPAEVYHGGGSLTGYWAEMTAAEATDADGDVEYFFECTDNSGFNSGWQSDTYYEVQIGRKNQLLRFHVKARDIYGNETAYSPELPAM